MTFPNEDFSFDTWTVESVVEVAVDSPGVEGDIAVHGLSAQIDSLSDDIVRLTEFSTLTEERFDARRVFGELLGLTPALSGVFVSRGTGQASSIETMVSAFVFVGTRELGLAEDNRRLESVILNFPIYTFGSPPHTVSTLSQVVASVPTAAIVGTSAATGQLGLGVLSGAVATLIWFGKPAARVVRRSLAERVAERMGTTMRDEDER